MSEEFVSKHTAVPFDLNKIVHFSLGFDQLQIALEHILDELAKQGKLIDRMDKDVRSRTYIVDK